LHISEFVHFAGSKRDLRPWLAAMDIFVLPSLWEGLPNAVLEAMAAGVPIVATNVDGVPEIVNDNSTGILCAPGDSQALFSAVQQLIIKSDLGIRIGNAGQRRVSEHFRFEDMLQSYAAAYNRIAADAAV
jgi:glycosyltransferase involved in cell wall biosynthesis